VRHLILGTAGHIDHGKTALIKALTGIDCDTHKDEKRRGITINLGFAHMDLSPGLSLGVVDVPGHQDFVHTMVGGASGVDLAMLVVAADSGVMPQTREHLHIMDVLDMGKGLVAVTKIDLVDKDVVAMAREEVGEVVGGTFLEGCHVAAVSSVTGEGLEGLKQCIEEVACGVPERPVGEVFRMFVDRIFTVSGFGTVVTGSVISGTMRSGGAAYLLPGSEKKLRVRRLERHGREVEQVVAGDRASINLVGLGREDFRRGMIVSDRVLRSTTMLDVKLRLFQHGRRLRLWNQVVFHLGTVERLAKLHLIDRDRLAEGEGALAQIHIGEPCVAQHGDRFVIRSSSGDVTLGGGEVIDAAPLHHRRRPAKLIVDMATIASGDLPERVASEIKKCFRAISHVEIADSLNVSGSRVLDVVHDGIPDDVVAYSSGDAVYFLVASEHERLSKQVLKNLAAFHRRNPLDERGRSTEELMGILGVAAGSSAEALLRRMLEKMTTDAKLKQVGRTWAIREHSVVIGPEMGRNIESIEGYLEKCGMSTPLMSDLVREARGRRMDEYGLNQVLRHLVSTGRAYFVEGNYVHGSVVDRCRKMLLKRLAGADKGMTVAAFRDLVHGNRKICLLLLAIYDSEGVTERQGDARFLTDKGREALSKRSS